MRHKIEHAIRDDHLVHSFFKIYGIIKPGRFAVHEHLLLSRQILVSELNQAHIDDNTYEEEQNAI